MQRFQRDLPLARGFSAGLLAGAVTTLAIAQGVFTGAPVVALALWERVLGLIPMRLFSFLIVHLKFAAKPLAFWGMLAGLVLLFAVGGALSAKPFSRRPWITGALLWLLSSGFLAFLTFPSAAVYLAGQLSAKGIVRDPRLLQLSVLAATLGYGCFYAVTFAIVLWAIQNFAHKAGSQKHHTPDLPSEAQDPPLGEITRRTLLLAFLALTGSLFLGLRRAWAAASDLFSRIKGLPPEVTPNDKFYVVSKNPPGFDPAVDSRTWALEITGLVGKPIRLRYEEIRAMPAVEQYQTLECISNEVGGDLISNAKWRGVRLRDVLERAGGPLPKAVKVAFHCADGYATAIPLVDAVNPTTLLAYEMNGEPLPREHGFPIRLLVPGLYGMKNPKWITRIEVVDYDFQGFWEKQGWSDEAVVKTMSKFTTLDRRILPMGELPLGGVAYSGDRGIREVEYSIDGGLSWQKAEIKQPLGKFTWVLWGAFWKPPKPGEYILKVRAKDGSGVLQIERERPPLPEGATGYHTVRIRIR
ncbi:MAG: molybdopterin-dependent oxidoreductase [Armatimonadota bacterium]|nr:molybdopterin-dependent oxidoreductase [Armatimonadota bacterium]